MSVYRVSIEHNYELFEMLFGILTWVDQRNIVWWAPDPLKEMGEFWGRASPGRM